MNTTIVSLDVITMMLQVVVLVALVGLVSADFDPELHAKYLTMPKSSFIEYFNAQNYSWKITDGDNIKKKYANCAQFDMESKEKLPILIHDLEAIDLPDNFDAREKWPQCQTIKEIYDQGSCGSCWAFGAVTAASDRTCIHKDVHVRLSEQDVECLKRSNNKGVCRGGFSIEVFKFWQDEGLVTQECKPYDIRELEQKKCVTECVNPEMNYKQEKHFAEKYYRLSDESDQIKAELVNNGPIQAGFNVFEDFEDYKSGIYIHKYGTLGSGRHSVRVIGYGVENGIDYWLVANSWGTDWGENGFFRIKSYQEDVQFEETMNSGLPKN